MKKIQQGDDVVIIAGKDIGKRGSVTQVLSNNKVIVEGLNLVKRHTKANPNQGKPGGIISKEAPLAVSNVMLFNPQTGKGDRVGFRVSDDGHKIRYFKSTDQTVDV